MCFEIEQAQKEYDAQRKKDDREFERLMMRATRGRSQNQEPEWQAEASQWLEDNGANDERQTTAEATPKLRERPPDF